MGLVATPQFAQAADMILASWEDTPGAHGPGVATALHAAVGAVEAERATGEIEVVWTGPPAPGVPIRLTSSVVGEIAATRRNSLQASASGSVLQKEIPVVLSRATPFRPERQSEARETKAARCRFRAEAEASGPAAPWRSFACLFSFTLS
jgi:hypothetical protein